MGRGPNVAHDAGVKVPIRGRDTPELWVIFTSRNCQFPSKKRLNVYFIVNAVETHDEHYRFVMFPHDLKWTFSSNSRCLVGTHSRKGREGRERGRELWFRKKWFNHHCRFYKRHFGGGSPLYAHLDFAADHKQFTLRILHTNACDILHNGRALICVVVSTYRSYGNKSFRW